MKVLKAVGIWYSWRRLKNLAYEQKENIIFNSNIGWLHFNCRLFYFEGCPSLFRIRMVEFPLKMKSSEQILNFFDIIEIIVLL